ncbi:hypothetical protein T08_8454 [Trichinella sp. T8]|nr:hypothetical protein T08_8454 [Trichinella sp. T8]
MGATLFFAGRFFCALMMTLAVSVSYDHREQEQTIFRYHRIEHIEEQYDGPSIIFLLAGVQPYEVVQIVCTRHYRGSFVMRMVDNSESHFLFPGTVSTVVVFHTRIFFASSTLLRMPAGHPSTAYSEWCNCPPLLHHAFRVVYPPAIPPPHIQSGVIARHSSTAHSEWYTPPPLHRPFNVFEAQSYVYYI